MVRPSKKSSEKTISVSVSMTPNELNIIDAARGQQSRSAYMRWKAFGTKKSKERRQ